MTPDQAVFNVHCEQARFQLGVANGWWKVEKVDWPTVVISIPAKRPSKEVDQYYFRFNLHNYPQNAPTSYLCGPDGAEPLPSNLWPFGGENVRAAFHPEWKSNALYIACDREAMVGHDPWRDAHPDVWWTPDKTITTYLTEVHELLNHRDYEGPRSG